MGYETFEFPAFLGKTVYVTVYKDVPQVLLSEIKSKLIEGDKRYDFCFLNPSMIVSKEYLLAGIYRAVQKYETGQASAKTLNTEIILNMSPNNNIMDALKRFGIDASKEKSHLICVKVVDSESVEEVNSQLVSVFKGESNSVVLDDELLFENLDVPKFKKLFKLNDAKIGNTQEELTKLAIGAGLLRGH